jgi:hypothetical protein
MGMLVNQQNRFVACTLSLFSGASSCTWYLVWSLGVLFGLVTMLLHGGFLVNSLGFPNSKQK